MAHIEAEDKKCHIEEGIVFVFDDESNGTENIEDAFIENGIEEGFSACEKFAEEQFRRPEHQHIKVGLRRLNAMLASIKSGRKNTSRQQGLAELESLLAQQHEIEMQVEKIENMYLREYAHELLDKMASARRSLGEEIRWEIEADKLAN